MALTAAAAASIRVQGPHGHAHKSGGSGLAPVASLTVISPGAESRTAAQHRAVLVPEHNTATRSSCSPAALQQSGCSCITYHVANRGGVSRSVFPNWRSSWTRSRCRRGKPLCRRRRRISPMSSNQHFDSGGAPTAPPPLLQEGRWGM